VVLALPAFAGIDIGITGKNLHEFVLVCLRAIVLAFITYVYISMCKNIHTQSAAPRGSSRDRYPAAAAVSSRVRGSSYTGSQSQLQQPQHTSSSRGGGNSSSWGAPSWADQDRYALQYLTSNLTMRSLSHCIACIVLCDIAVQACEELASAA
jgi:hypothetical protein